MPFVRLSWFCQFLNAFYINFFLIGFAQIPPLVFEAVAGFEPKSEVQISLGLAIVVFISRTRLSG